VLAFAAWPADRLRRPTGVTADLRLTFHLGHSAGGDHSMGVADLSLEGRT
jgi:hypothetical protein